jgi:transposase-like protein
MAEQKKNGKEQKDLASLEKEEEKLKKEVAKLDAEEKAIENQKSEELEESIISKAQFSRICPNCKSFNVKSDYPISPAYGVADYVCLDCNFRSKIFPEINIHNKKETEEIKSEIKEEER